MRHGKLFTALSLVLLLAVACAPPLPTAEERAVATDTPLPATPTTAATPTPPPEDEPAAERVIDLARADLAEKLGLAKEEIDVQSVEAVQWRDSSLGCPEEGKMYLQVITPGYRVVLSAGGETYEYHTDRSRAVLCDPEGRLSTAPPSAEQKEPVIAEFDPDRFLFVEIKEVRITLSEGQTTSFEGEMPFYTYDQAGRSLKGDVGFSVDDALRLVIGREVTVQIGDNRAFSGQLYGYPGELPASLPIQFTKLSGDGGLCFLLDGREYCLESGDSQSFDLSTKSTEDESLPIAQKVSMTVVNHGFLEKQDLQIAPQN
jgi:hypothetical protein